MTITSRIYLLVLGIFFGRALFAEQMVIEKQIRLSPGHHVMPYQVNRASNGDLIVTGSSGQGDYKTWATRVSATGDTRWQFIDGGVDGWNDRSVLGQRFYGAVDLPDNTTVLCGIKQIARDSTVVLDRINSVGALVEERLLHPNRPDVVLSAFNCGKWNDGIVLMGSVSGQPAGTGWLAKLDFNLNVEWERFGSDYANGDFREFANGIQIISWAGSQFYIVSVDGHGDVIARHPLPEADLHLVHGQGTGSVSRVVAVLSTENTQILTFDRQFHGPSPVVSLHNVGAKKSLELSDGSIAIFGSQAHNGATAAITRVYPGGDSRSFVIEPPHESAWYFDAAPAGGYQEFVAVRLVQADAVMDWVSFK